MNYVCFVAIYLYFSISFVYTYQHDRQLLNQLEQLSAKRVHIEKYFEQFDFRDVPANGFRSLGKLIDKFFNVVLKVSPDVESDRHTRKLKNIAAILLQAVALCERYASNQASRTSGLLENLSRKQIRAIKRVGPFHLEPSLWLPYKILDRIMYHRLHNIGHISDETHKFDIASDYAVSATYRDVRKVWNFLESKLVTAYYETTLPVIDFRNITIPTHGQHIKDKITCQVVRNSLAPSMNLLLHIHGGGFVAQSPRGHQGFLRKWARQMPDTALLSPYYSLSPEAKFPAALMEVFEVYRFLVQFNRDPVRRTLFFDFDQVVVLGNSVGGNLALALCRLLVQENVPLPAKLILVNPYLVPSPTYPLPSRTLTLFDPVLPPAVMLAIPEAYCPGSSSQQPWHFSDATARRRLKAMEAMAINPLYNPIAGKLIGLESLHLSVLVGEFDPLLDDSVTLAKKWPGPVRLIVFDGLTHAYLFVSGTSVMAAKAARVTMQVIEESFQLS
ncbi:Hormone-sensitive lipase [Halotydeus destructor]|nr:Hormone-sensitive lipase [Halotydeus destructor]